MESVRFTAPVKIGDTIHCEVKVTDLSVKDHARGIIAEENVIKNQRGETVIVFVMKFLVGRRP
jgi:acyl dehydratase